MERVLLQPANSLLLNKVLLLLQDLDHNNVKLYLDRPNEMDINTYHSKVKKLLRENSSKKKPFFLYLSYLTKSYKIFGENMNDHSKECETTGSYVDTIFHRIDHRFWCFNEKELI